MVMRCGSTAVTAFVKSDPVLSWKIVNRADLTDMRFIELHDSEVVIPVCNQEHRGIRTHCDASMTHLTPHPTTPSHFPFPPPSP